MPRKPPRPPARGEPRDVAELTQILELQPELTSAAELQIALLELQRRVQSRAPLPRKQVDLSHVQTCQATGHPLLRFEEIPLDWTDFRLMFREAADLLRRYELLPEDDWKQVQELLREGNALKPLVVEWYTAAAGRSVDAPAVSLLESTPHRLDHVVQLAMGPFLARCAEAILPGLDLSPWNRPRCPLCGGEPDFATITPAADRLLICGRCTGQWPYDPLTCPFCRNADRSRITSFTSPEGIYRIYACDVCRRYLKTYDGRRATRPVMVAVDSVKTLPLDAAVLQKGYLG